MYPSKRPACALAAAGAGVPCVENGFAKPAGIHIALFRPFRLPGSWRTCFVMTQKALYEHDSGFIYRTDIVDALREAGVAQGDTLLVHSALGSFGKLGDVMSRDAFLGEVLDAFLEAIGMEGTLVVPAFTYSFCRGEDFDVDGSPSTVGTFTEYVRQREKTIRSEDPIFSHAGIGKMAKPLLVGTGDICFGEDSFFDRFYRFGGKVINFGKFFDITFLHYIEKSFGVGYRYEKTFNGNVVHSDGHESPRSVSYYVRALPEDSMDVQYDMTNLGDELERRGLLNRVVLGASFILCSDVKDCFDVGMEMLEADEYAFLRYNPVISQK